VVPIIVLVVSFAAFRLAGFGIPYLADLQHALRAVLGVMFLTTASAHWGRRRPDLMRMVPAAFGNAGRWVTITGIAEILVAVGLQLPRAAVVAASSAAVMLICVFPANMKAARERLTIGGRPVPGLWAWLAIQVVFLVALAAAVWPLQ
jgi:uncharacterized membrane protein